MEKVGALHVRECEPSKIQFVLLLFVYANSYTLVRIAEYYRIVGKPNVAT